MILRRFIVIGLFFAAATGLFAAPAVTLTDVSCIADSTVGYAAHPSLAGDGGGMAWLCWLNRAHGGVEQVMAKTFAKGAWGEPFVVAPTGMYDRPVVACAKKGKPIAAWVVVNDGRWEIAASRWEGDKFGAPAVVVTGEDGRCRNPALAAGPNGTFALAWESYRQGAFRVFAKVFDGQKWGPSVEVGEAGFNCYNPAVVFQGDTLWLAFSKAYKATSGARDLVLCALDARTLAAKERRVAASGSRMSFPALWPDAVGRLWLAGVDLGAANQFKATTFVLSRADGSFQIPAGMELVATAGRGKGSQLTMPYLNSKSDLNSNATYPVLVQDSQGRLVTLMREAITDTAGQNLSGRRAWTITASVLTEQGWTTPSRLIDTPVAGRKEQLGATALGDGTMLVVWQQDNIYSPTTVKQYARLPLPYVPNDQWTSTLYSGRLSVDDDAPAAEKVALKKFDVPVIAPAANETVTRPSPVTVGKYAVLWGNIHEHSDFSICNSKGTDGSLDDNYRHCLDATPVDFFAMTDHTQHMNEFMWREHLRTSDYYNDPPHFIVFPGNENSMGETSVEEFNANLRKNGTPEAIEQFTLTKPFGGYGHYNIFFPSTKEAAKFVYQLPDGRAGIYNRHLLDTMTIIEMCAKLRAIGADALVIPHQLACPDGHVDWNAFQPDLMPVCEIYQSRGSYEYEGAPGDREEKLKKSDREKPKKKPGHFVHDAFAKGLKFGFIASGDHNNIGTASTAVLVKEKTPPGIFEALRAARCYATSTPGYDINVEFTANGHLMGERVRDTAPEVKIVANLQTKYAIESVALFKNNKNLLPEGTTTAKIEFVDKPTEDECYYYLRVVTAKGIAWTSPVWVTRK